MHLGLVGLGKMGANMRARWREHGCEVTGFDVDPEVSDVESLEALVAAVPTPRIVWVMVPSGDVTHQTIARLAELLDPGDLVIDGGNSRWTDDTAHAELLADSGIRYLDCGVSGGVWGRENGYALMVGGSTDDVEFARPVFDALTPDDGRGYAHAGGIGAGHYSKMVHNGIEYAMMQALAEGWELMESAEIVDDVPEVLASWRSGTVVRSWLLDLLVDALHGDEHLDDVPAWAADSGEGRWTVEAAIDQSVPTPTIAASLFARFVSRQDGSPAMKAIAAMRNQFGGHGYRRQD